MWSRVDRREPTGMSDGHILSTLGLVTYRGCIPARRRSPIPALTGLNVEQLRSCDERRYHIAKPPTIGHRERCSAAGKVTVGWVRGYSI